jgi:hypothetical protein
MRETAEWRVLFLSDGETKRGVRRMAGRIRLRPGVERTSRRGVAPQATKE